MMMRGCRFETRYARLWAAGCRRKLLSHAVVLVPIALGLLTASPALGFKWHSCPGPPLPVYPSARGATNAPFAHPGHELTILLNDDELAKSGGFSDEIDGNEVSVAFHSLFGALVALPSRFATATSPAVMTLTFPDSREDGEGVLAGPVEIRVYARGQLIAHIHWSDFVGLPPANDVMPIVLRVQPDQIVFAALGADGDLWIPARFAGDPMDMPSCPGNFIWPVRAKIGAAKLATGLPDRLDPLRNIRGVVGYLGDMIVREVNLYGMLYPEDIRLVHVADTLGVSICRLNDATDLVLRVRGDASWAVGPRSPFRLACADSQPVPLVLKAADPVPGDGHPVQGLDSFGSECSPQPIVERGR